MSCGASFFCIPFYTWEDYGLKRPKNEKWTKIDYVMWGIFLLYSAYYLSIETW